MRLGRVAAIACLSTLVPGLALAEGKVAVLNLEKAIFETNEAQKQLEALRQTPDFQSNKKEYDRLKKQYEDLAQQFNKNREVMSAEQEAEQARKLKDVETDFEFVAKKLQQAQATVAQRVMRELGPRANTVVMDLIKAEGIGLLLNAQAALYAEPGFVLDAKVTDKLNQGGK